jgi:hypothetical protein
MKISSQLANNLDYCSAEFLTTNSPLCALNASVVNHLTPPLWAHVLRGEIVFHDLSVIRYVG